MQRFNPLTSVIGHPRRKRRWIPLVVALVFSTLLTARPAQAELFDQYQVKAVFLLNLTHFIQWPDAPSPIGDKPFTITIFGRDKIYRHLENVVKGEVINGRKVAIRHTQSLAELEQHSSDILFVSDDQMALWPQIRAITRRLLTVSDVEGFAHRSGMVNLLTSGRRIRIEINIIEARRNGFDISAKLLKLAHIINSGKDD